MAPAARRERPSSRNGIAPDPPVAASCATVSADAVEPVIPADDAKPGELFATDPPGGTKVEAGSTVRVLVSLGIPTIAYDNDKDLLLVNGDPVENIELIADPSKNFLIIMKDGKIYKDTLPR